MIPSFESRRADIFQQVLLEHDEQDKNRGQPQSFYREDAFRFVAEAGSTNERSVSDIV